MMAAQSTQRGRNTGYRLNKTMTKSVTSECHWFLVEVNWGPNWQNKLSCLAITQVAVVASLPPLPQILPVAMCCYGLMRQAGTMGGHNAWDENWGNLPVRGRIIPIHMASLMLNRPEIVSGHPSCRVVHCLLLMFHAVTPVAQIRWFTHKSTLERSLCQSAQDRSLKLWSIKCRMTIVRPEVDSHWLTISTMESDHVGLVVTPLALEQSTLLGIFGRKIPFDWSSSHTITHLIDTYLLWQTCSTKQQFHSWNRCEMFSVSSLADEMFSPQHCSVTVTSHKQSNWRCFSSFCPHSVHCLNVKTHIHAVPISMSHCDS